jgi:hypothetical protein
MNKHWCAGLVQDHEVVVRECVCVPRREFWFGAGRRLDARRIRPASVNSFIACFPVDVEQTGPWYWIFSNHLGWGSFQYDPKYDALRVPVTAQDAAFTEFMTYGFDEQKPDSAVAFLQWEEKRIPFKIEVSNVNELYVAKIRRQLESWPGFRYEDTGCSPVLC